MKRRKEEDEVEGEDERSPLLGSGGRSSGQPSGQRGVDEGTSKTAGTKDEEKKKKEEKPKGVSLSELFSFANCFDRLIMALGLVASAAMGAAWPFMMLLFGHMTNDFLDYGKNSTGVNTTGKVNESMIDAFEDKMSTFALNYTYIGLGVFVCAYCQVAFLQLSCERQTYKLRLAFFNALLRQNIAWYDRQQSGDLTTKLTSDLERVREGIGDKVGLSVQFLAQFVAGFVMGFVQGWKMTLVIMSIAPLLAIGAGMLGKLMVSYSTLEQLSYAKAGGIAEEVLSCIRTVTSFNGQFQEIKKYTAALSKCMKLGVKKSVFGGLSIGSTLLIMFCAYGLAFWFGSRQVNDYNESGGHDGYSPGTVLTVFFSVMIGSFALGNASPHISSFLTAKGAGGTLFPIIRNKPSIDSSDPGGQRPSTIEGRIKLRNVFFSYPTRPEAKILHDFSLDIEPGQTVALVGASGCGKSTIVNLVQRFYDPQEGKVELDGVDIRDLNLHWLRGNIGVVSQEPILFGMSIAENIRLGQPDASMEDIQTAAKMANAHDFISSLPEGYDTLVGERGGQLSGGQKQRVAIARALVRDPRILLLDEATSALDSESEGIVQAALDKAGVGRTTIIIAHRLSTIQKADVIYVLSDGCVVEHGKHAELMDRKQTYHSLVMLQEIATNDDEMSQVTDDQGSQGEQNGGELRKRTLSSQLSSPAAKRQLSSQSTDSHKSKLARKAEEDTDDKDEDIEKPTFVRIFKSNLKEWPFIVVGCFCAILNGLTFPLFAIFFSEIIKTFNKTGDELLDDGLLWSMMFIALGVLNFFANVGQQSLFGFSGERLTYRLRHQAFANILRQDIPFFDDPKHSTGALTTRLATDATMVKTATGIRLAMILQSLTSMVAGLVIAFVFGWKLALALLGGIPIMMFAGAIHMKTIKGKQQRDSLLLEEAGKTASECVENISTVQGLTREPYFYKIYSDKLMKPYKENRKLAHITGLSHAFSQAVVFFLYAAAFRFGAWLIAHDGMEPGMVFRVFFAITFTGMSVGQGMSFLPDYAKAQLSASKMFDLLDTVPGIDVFNTGGQVKNSISGETRVKGVHFRYPTRPEVAVLMGVDLVVSPGQTVALVGMSGCGKSTVLSLIQRFYDPQEGSICIEGVDVKDYNVKHLRSMISVVSQEPVLFDASIRENILYGLDPSADLSMTKVIHAARTANAHDFITKFPDGYETNVGEKGTQLSGGQKQRIAIARALIRNPKILLLDEATSALDSESEKIVQAALDQARQGRTCIVIAHRLSTIQNADRIYVMDGGRVAESGTHQSLLASGGPYSLLVKGQQFRSDNDAC